MNQFLDKTGLSLIFLSGGEESQVLTNDGVCLHTVCRGMEGIISPLFRVIKIYDLNLFLGIYIVRYRVY